MICCSFGGVGGDVLSITSTYLTQLCTGFVVAGGLIVTCDLKQAVKELFILGFEAKM